MATRAAELRVAIRELNDRCLYASVKWAAEILYSDADPNAADAVSAASSPAATETVPALDPALLLAKSYFDAKEYRRCAHVLRDAAAPSTSSPSPPSWHAVFLRGYALFMAGEKQKEEEIFEAKDLSHAAVGVRFLGAAASSQRGAATNADGSVSGARAVSDAIYQ